MCSDGKLVTLAARKMGQARHEFIMNNIYAWDERIQMEVDLVEKMVAEKHQPLVHE